MHAQIPDLQRLVVGEFIHPANPPVGHGHQVARGIRELVHHEKRRLLPRDHEMFAIVGRLCRGGEKVAARFFGLEIFHAPRRPQRLEVVVSARIRSRVLMVCVCALPNVYSPAGMSRFSRQRGSGQGSDNLPAPRAGSRRVRPDSRRSRLFFERAPRAPLRCREALTPPPRAPRAWQVLDELAHHVPARARPAISGRRAGSPGNCSGC